MNKRNKLISIAMILVLVLSMALFVCSCETKEETKDTEVTNESISVTGPSEVTVGEFDYSQYTVTVKKSDNSTEDTALTKEMLSVEDQAKLNLVGDQIITVSYLDLSCSFSIKIKAKESVSTISFDNKVEKYTGEEIKIEVTNLPSGASVTYSPKNSFVEAGVYEVTALVKQSGKDDITLTATLTITRELHSVTFKQEGKADIVKQVLDLGALTDIPTIDKMPGYQVKWSVEDFSCITQDIVVTVIKEGDGVVYTLSQDKTYYIASAYYGKDSKLVIKSEYKEPITNVNLNCGISLLADPVDKALPVKEVASGCFKNCETLEEVEIPNTVTTIGNDAFKGCKKLNSIVIPESVVTIGTGAIDGSDSVKVFTSFKTKPAGWSNDWNTTRKPVVWDYGGLKGMTENGIVWSLKSDDTIKVVGYIGNGKKIVVPAVIEGKQVNEIFSYSFVHKNIGIIELEEGIKVLGKDAFYQSSYDMIILPKSLKEINNHYALGEMYSRAEALPNGWNAYYEDVIKFNFKAYGETAQGLQWVATKDNKASILKYNGSNKDIVIPENIEGNVVTKIIGIQDADNMWQSDSQSIIISSIQMPNTITYIAPKAFYKLATLEKINLSTAITVINIKTFAYCELLKEITIPDSVISIEEGAFTNCKSLKGIKLKDNISYVGPNAFAYCDELSIALVSKEVPTTWSKDWNSTACRVDLDCEALTGKTKDGFTWTASSNNEITINKYEGTSVDVMIPETINLKPVTTIASNAFIDLTQIKTIIIPKTVLTINKDAFKNLTSLEVFFVEAKTVPSTWDAAWSGNATVFKDYKNAKGKLENNLLWQLEKDGYIRIIGYEYHNGIASSDIVIPNEVKGRKVKYLSANIFTHVGIKSLTLPDYLETLEEGVFAKASIEKIIFSKAGNLKYIKKNAFNGLRNNSDFIKLEIPSGVLEIEAMAFYGANLVILPTGIEKVAQNIGNGLFLLYDDVLNPNWEGLNQPNDKVVLGYKGNIIEYKGLQLCELQDNTLIVFGYIGKDKDIIIPSKINEKVVSKILSNSISLYEGNVVIGAGIDTIERQAIITYNNASIFVEDNAKQTNWDPSWEIGCNVIYNYDITKNLRGQEGEFSWAVLKDGTVGLYNNNGIKDEIKVPSSVKVNGVDTKVSMLGKGAIRRDKGVKQIILPKLDRVIDYAISANIFSNEKVKIYSADISKPVAWETNWLDEKNDGSQYIIIWDVNGSIGTYKDFNYMENKNGGITISEYVGSNPNVIVPDTINNKNVDTIYEDAFVGTKINYVVMPKNLKSIIRSTEKKISTLPHVLLFTYKPNQELVSNESFFGILRESMILSKAYFGVKDYGIISGTIWVEDEKGISVAANEVNAAVVEIPKEIKGSPITKLDPCSFIGYSGQLIIPNSIATMPLGTILVKDSDRLVVYIEAPSKPEGWDNLWYCDYRSILDQNSYPQQNIKVNLVYGYTNNAQDNNGNVMVTDDEGNVYYLYEDHASLFMRSSNAKDVLMPSKIVVGNKEYKVTTIEHRAFEHYNLETVVIAPTVEEILNDLYFENDNIKNIVIPSTVKTISVNFPNGCVLITELESALPNWMDNDYAFNFAGTIGETEDGFRWITTKDGSISIIKYCGKSSYVEIPDTINGKQVKTLTKSSFRIETVKNVVIPEGLVNIDEATFNSSEPFNVFFKAKEVSISMFITLSGGNDRVFENFKALPNIQNSLCDYYITNDDKAAIMNYKGSELEIYLPREIDGYVVAYVAANSLSMEAMEVHLPSTVENIGKGMLAESPFLKIFCNFDKREDGGWGYVQNFIYWNPTGLKGTTIDGFSWLQVQNDEIVITGYTGSAEVIEIPETIEGFNVTAIGASAFANMEMYYPYIIKEIKIPNTIKEIGAFAFAGSSVQKVNIPEGITKLSTGVFYESMVKEVNLPSSLKYIASVAIGGSSKNLKYIVIPNGVEIIEPEGIGYYDNPGLRIFCEADKQPTTWSDGWTGPANVIWGFTGKYVNYTFNSNGGTKADSINAKYPIDLPEVNKEGFVFYGWYDNPELKGEKVPANYYSEKDVTLYAKYITQEEYDSLFDGHSFDYALKMDAQNQARATFIKTDQFKYVKFVPQEDGQYTITVKGSIDLSTVDVYDANQSYLTQAHGAPGTKELTVMFNFTKGTTYYIRVQTWNQVGYTDVSAVKQN